MAFRSGRRCTLVSVYLRLEKSVAISAAPVATAAAAAITASSCAMARKLPKATGLKGSGHEQTALPNIEQ